MIITRRKSQPLVTIDSSLGKLEGSSLLLIEISELLEGMGRVFHIDNYATRISAEGTDQEIREFECEFPCEDYNSMEELCLDPSPLLLEKEELPFHPPPTLPAGSM